MTRSGYCSYSEAVVPNLVPGAPRLPKCFSPTLNRRGGGGIDMGPPARLVRAQIWVPQCSAVVSAVLKVQAAEPERLFRSTPLATSAASRMHSQ